MQRSSLIAVAIAVLLGAVAVYLANSYFSAQERRIEQANVGTTRVAIAARPMNYGEAIQEQDVRFADYPTDTLPPGTYASLEELMPDGQTRHVLRPLQVNQPLLAADLTGEGEGASLAAILPEGMRATTVQINAISGVAGFIHPNDTVDVVITRQAIGGGGGTVTDVLLQNVRVIAMDQRAQDDASGNAVVSNTATLEVTPVDAQKLVLGQQLGTLSLILRKPGVEENIGRVETVSLDDLRYELSRNAAGRVPEQQRPAAQRRPVRPVPRPAPPPRPSVDVVRGTASQSYEVGEYE
ncbi:Flp pilus assembly protein CpaB [Sphingomicrobium clamense]|uniref:Flp pilus assembly protein CpaB n=1 Tax=Sphingomicrobium clamense TaxID=2851013 RepID=A0ABS6V3I1_9SPHN|nr:Flp pilus assembly protein CpaB [Sphingomicrobium sp. B8]MBW0144056.1 Flp pilus assembly protein CpaB [Sphingomicrobium sp. B8]